MDNSNRARAIAEFEQGNNNDNDIMDKETAKIEAEEAAETLESRQKEQAMGAIESTIITENRIGIFGIDDNDLLSSLIRTIMGFCIVVRAEYFMHSKSIEYIAYSKMFEPIPAGQPTPRYMWVMNKQGDIKARNVDEQRTIDEASQERSLDKLESGLKEPIADVGANA